MSARGESNPKSAAGHSRRAVLAGAAAGAAALAVRALEHPLTVEAAGNDGATIHVGDTIADAQTQTTLANQANAGRVLWVASNDDLGHGDGVAVTGYSAKKIGVEGLAGGIPADEPNNVGVFGYSNGNVGVWGRGGWGVAGEGSVIGVEGTSTTGGTGVDGIATTGIGTVGSATTGVGVQGYVSNRAGVAIRAYGRIHFPTVSGVAKIAAGKASITLTMTVNVTSSSFVLLTPRSNIGTRSLWYTIDATNDKITIHMSSTRSKATDVAWLLIG